MEMNVKPYGKNGLRCMLCDKKFSTENLMAVHFSRRHREEAMGESRAAPVTFPCASPPPHPPPPPRAFWLLPRAEWAESMDGELPSSMDEAMLMQARD